MLRSHQARWVLMAIAFGVSAIGCKKLFRKPPPAIDAGAPVPVTARTLTPLVGPYDLKFKELPAAHVMFPTSGTRLEVRAYSFPSGTVLEIDGRRTTLSSSSSGDGIELIDKIADLRPGDATTYAFKLDTKTSFSLEVPGYSTVTLGIPPHDVLSPVHDTFIHAVDRPVLLPGEASTDAPSPVHTILYLTRFSNAMDVFGAAPTMREVDWVALGERMPERKGATCLVKRAGTAGPTPAVPTDHALIDTEVLVAERKTAKIVMRKTFPADTKCPTTVYEATAKTYADEAEIKRWLRDVRSTAR